MENTQTVKFFNRGPTPLVRLVFFSLLSLLLLFVDARYKYLESTRSVLSTLIYPLQRAAAFPSMLFSEIDDFFTTQTTLRRDNAQLREQHARDSAELQQLQGVMAENAHLRTMLEVRQRLKRQMRLVRIVYAERDPFQHKVMVDLSGQSGIEAGDAVLDSLGVVGQVTEVFPSLAEVTLITDKDHEVPVQVLRNGDRTILFGSGSSNEVELRYMPVAADIKVGDLLVTSGIGGTYPAGLPVAKVARVERDPDYPFAHVICTPVAGVSRNHWLFILSGKTNLPSRPEHPDENASAKSRKKPK
jgi:rod shape-determining protein MreC